MSYASSSRAPHAGQRASQGVGLLGGLGRACYRHRWITLFTWIIGVACLIALWLQFGAAALNTFNSSDPGQTVLNQHFPRASGRYAHPRGQVNGPGYVAGRQGAGRQRPRPVRAGGARHLGQ